MKKKLNIIMWKPVLYTNCSWEEAPMKKLNNALKIKIRPCSKYRANKNIEGPQKSVLLKTVVFCINPKPVRAFL